MSFLWDLQKALLRGDYDPIISRVLQYYREHGESFRITVNSALKRIDLQIVWKGSPHPLDIGVTSYSIEERDGQVDLVFHGIDTPWKSVNAVFRASGKTPRIRIPPQYASWLGHLL
jgi:hypothetical protein